MIDFFIACYLLHDYAMKEKEEMDRLEGVLREGKVSESEGRHLEELANWHFENYMEAVKEGGIPWCVCQYLFGYRGRPEPREIYEEYARRREYFKGKERVRKKIVLSFAIAVLYILFKFWFGN